MGPDAPSERTREVSDEIKSAIHMTGCCGRMRSAPNAPVSGTVWGSLGGPARLEEVTGGRPSDFKRFAYFQLPVGFLCVGLRM